MKRIFTLLLVCFCLQLHAQSSKKTHTYDEVQNVEWAKPANVSLTMDIYTPKPARRVTLYSLSIMAVRG
jgi:hypothetical protein